MSNTNISDTNITFNTNQEFYDGLKKLNYSNNPLNDLASASSVIVYYGTPCFNLRCCIPLSCLKCNCTCDDYFNYTTLINGRPQKFLFKNIAKLNCSICSLDKVSRFANCKSYSLSSYDEYSKEGGVQIVEMVKDPGCILFGICALYLNVFISSENRLAGIVKYRGCCEAKCKESCQCKRCGNCCYDYFYCCEILSPNKETIFIIYLKKCCLSCVPVDCCDEINFTINNAKGDEVGTIKAKRGCCNSCGICGTNFTYTINFPGGITPEIKLTIINAVISIDLFIL